MVSSGHYNLQKSSREDASQFFFQWYFTLGLSHFSIKVISIPLTFFYLLYGRENNVFGTNFRNCVHTELAPFWALLNLKIKYVVISLCLSGALLGMHVLHPLGAKLELCRAKFDIHFQFFANKTTFSENCRETWIPVGKILAPLLCIMYERASAYSQGRREGGKSVQITGAWSYTRGPCSSKKKIFLNR